MHKYIEKFKNWKVKILYWEMHVIIPALVVIAALVGVVVLIPQINAVTYNWTQTDWSGGQSSAVINSNANTYLSSSSTTATSNTPGAITLVGDGWPVSFNTWDYRKKLTLNNTAANIGVTSENLTNFPVLIKLTGGSNIDYSKTNNDGSDIRFSDSDGTVLDYEIDEWNESGDSYIWVKVPQIDIESSTDFIYIYYGNSAATDAQNENSVWSNSYVGVWHLGETGNGTAGEFNDSSSTGADGQGGAGDAAATPVPVTGAIGTAQSFVSADYIYAGTSPNLKFSNVSWTASAWVNEIDLSNIRIVMGNDTVSNGWNMRLINTGGQFGLVGRGGGAPFANSVGTVTQNGWTHVTIVVNGTTGGTVSLYKNGVFDTSAGYGGNVATSSCGFLIGSRWTNTACTGLTLGTGLKTDEVQVSSVPRSAAWLAADYKSQTNQLISSYGSEEPLAVTLNSNIFDGGIPADWGTLTYTAAENDGTVTVRVRTGSQDDMSDAMSFDSCDPVTTSTDISSNNCVDDRDIYIQYQVVLQGTGGVDPVFDDISIDFSPSDEVKPTTNATNAALTGLDDAGWTNTEPVITWTAGEDDPGGVGILGNCVSLDEANLGSSNTLDPELSGGLLTGKDDGNIRTFCDFIATGTSLNLANIPGLTLTNGKQYYISLKAVDIGGNIYSGTSGSYQDLISFRYDNVEPEPPVFVSLPGSFVSDKAVTFTWPIVGGDAPSDQDSDISGLQYRISNSGTWYGDLHLGTEVASDILVNDGSYTMDATVDFPNLVEGNNFLYVRSVDIAGNFSSDYATGIIRINTNAPSTPLNLDVTPTTSDTNSYAFDWDVPATYIGAVEAITYCYSVNVLPSLSTCNFTSAGVTGLAAGAYATQPGTNTFYVVAKDEAGNINYATRASKTFSYTGEAPGIPSDLDIADISVRSTSNWKLVLTWAEPDDVGAGVASYRAFRSITGVSCSEDFSSYSQVGSTSGTSFVDAGLNQSTYYYCIKACDSANNCSAVTTTVSMKPTGKFTEPALLTFGPTASLVTTSRAVITWVTDRDSDSRIEFGLASGKYFDSELATAAQTTTHSITLSNLKPGTKYFYRVKWVDDDGNIGVSSEKTFTTEPPPTVESVSATNITISSALINFTSTNASKIKVYYGKEKTYGNAKELATSLQSGRYKISLTDLEDGTRYYYKVNMFDLEGIEYEGEIHILDTLPRPRVSAIAVEQIIDRAVPTVAVSWDSNAPITSIIDYYPADDPKDLRTVVNVDLVSGNHKLEVTNLKEETVYVLTVSGVDKIGNKAESTPQRFTTATDSRPPQVSTIKIEGNVVVGENLSEENSAQLIVTWDTDEPSTSQIEYGEGTGTDYTKRTQQDSNLTTNHIIVISNLTPSKVYHLRLLSTDAAGNIGASKDNVTITPKTNDDVFEILFGALEDVFSFLRR